MDYIVLSALKALGELPPLVLSYDIVCQWCINLWQRISQYPDELKIDLDEEDIRFAIPMYHFRVHKEKGHNQYSLHLLEGVGRSCCEGIERNWPKHEETAASTREMGPGSRHDTLEDHFGYANWRVYTLLGNQSVIPCKQIAHMCFRFIVPTAAQGGRTRASYTCRDIHSVQ